MSAVRDGRMELGCSYEQWIEGRLIGPRANLMPNLAAQIGATIPPIRVVADVAATPARIDWGRWCVDCPSEGCRGAQMVWLEGPYLFWCADCGNREVGGAHRPVRVPENHAEIAASLSALTVDRQNWRPVEASV